MSKHSAGIILYRKRRTKVEVLLVHPGGPFWKNKDEGAWSIPKGEFDETEDALSAAMREFKEETGQEINGSFAELRPVKMKSGKMIYAWLVQGDLNTGKARSNEFEIEWPPRSGKRASFPEVDRYEWFGLEEAKQKINAAQVSLIEEAQRIAEGSNQP